MAAGEFTITDGTVSVTLMDPGEDIHIREWSSRGPSPKDGGRFASIPFTPGRFPILLPVSNMIEELTLRVDGDVQTQTAPTGVLGDLLALLRQAQEFWIGGANVDPVYIQARGKDYTNYSYGHIIAASIPEIGDIFSPVGQAMVLDEVRLSIEHTGWRDHPPGVVADIPEEAYENGGSAATRFGTMDQTGTLVDTPTEFNAAIQTGLNPSNLTHVFRYDASATAFSGNILGTSGADLLPDPVAVGDILYIGIQNGTQIRPFQNVMFHMTGGNLEGVWEIYDGTWTAIAAFRDETNEMNESGFVGIWFRPDSWAATTINAVNGLWIRFRVTAVNSTTPPVMDANRNPFVANFPYLQIAPTVDNDLPVRLRVGLQPVDRGIGSSVPDSRPNTIVLGLREEARSADFTGYINLSGDYPGHANITVTAEASAGSFVADGMAPGGEHILFDVSVATKNQWVTASKITIGSAIVDSWIGSYRVFLRLSDGYSSSGPAYEVRLIVSDGEDSQIVISPDFIESEDNYALDLGRVSFPGRPTMPGDTHADIRMELQIRLEEIAASQNDIQLLDLVFIPEDEWIGAFVGRETDLDSDFSEDKLSWNGTNVRRLFVDSARNVRQYITAEVDDGAGNLETTWEPRAAPPIEVEAGKDHRLYVFAGIEDVNGILTSTYGTPFRVHVWGVHQFGVPRS